MSDSKLISEPHPVLLTGEGVPVVEIDGETNRTTIPTAIWASLPSKCPPPTYDPERGMLHTVAVHRLPLGYRPEPLNGAVAWLHAVTGLLAVFTCWGMSNAFGLFQEYYQTVHLRGTNPATIAWIGSTQLCLVFGLGVPVGRLVDRGYFRLVFHSGTLVMILGIFCSAWCVHFWSLWLVQGLVTGLGMGMVFCSGMVAMMTWFDEEHIGAAMGLAAAGSCIGGIVYVLIARHFLATHGFAATMRILGGVATATMIPPTLVFRVRGQAHRDIRRTRSLPSLAAATVRSFLEPSYLLAAGGMFSAFLGVYFGFVYMVLYGSTVLRLSATASSNLLIFMLAANLPGRFLPALISDRCIGPLNTIIPSVLLSSAVIWLWAASTPSQASQTVIACFYGFVSAGVQVLYAPTVYSFCLEPEHRLCVSGHATNEEGGPCNAATAGKKLSVDRVGIKAGGIFTCIGLACLVGSPIGGALISYRIDRDMGQPFLGSQIFAGVSLLLGGCLLLGSRVCKIGWAATKV